MNDMNIMNVINSYSKYYLTILENGTVTLGTKCDFNDLADKDPAYQPLRKLKFFNVCSDGKNLAKFSSLGELVSELLNTYTDHIRPPTPKCREFASDLLDALFTRPIPLALNMTKAEAMDLYLQNKPDVRYEALPHKTRLSNEIRNEISKCRQETSGQGNIFPDAFDWIAKAKHPIPRDRAFLFDDCDKLLIWAIKQSLLEDAATYQRCWHCNQFYYKEKGAGRKYCSEECSQASIDCKTLCGYETLYSVNSHITQKFVRKTNKKNKSTYKYRAPQYAFPFDDLETFFENLPNCTDYALAAASDEAPTVAYLKRDDFIEMKERFQASKTIRIAQLNALNDRLRRKEATQEECDKMAEEFLQWLKNIRTLLEACHREQFVCTD